MAEIPAMSVLIYSHERLTSSRPVDPSIYPSGGLAMENTAISRSTRAHLEYYAFREALHSAFLLACVALVT